MCINLDLRNKYRFYSAMESFIPLDTGQELVKLFLWHWDQGLITIRKQLRMKGKFGRRRVTFSLPDRLYTLVMCPLVEAAIPRVKTTYRVSKGASLKTFHLTKEREFAQLFDALGGPDVWKELRPDGTLLYIHDREELSIRYRCKSCEITFCVAGWSPTGCFFYR